MAVSDESIYDKVKAKGARFPVLVAAGIFVAVLVAGRYGFDLDADTVLSILAVVVPALFAETHRRVSPVGKTDRGFRRKRRVVVPR